MQAVLEKSWPSKDIVDDLARLRDRAPLTHCITNIVVAGFTANVLLAAGASPAMVNDAEEVAEFAAIAAGLLINVGTVTTVSAPAMRLAAASAQATGTPWVLDPVAVGAIAYRTHVATELLAHRPAIIRGNASEILALAGASAGGKGVDTTVDSAAALDDARRLAQHTGAVVAVSGVIDYLTDGRTVVSVPGGHSLMTKVTGVGCALGALMAAFLGVADTPLRAATAASAMLGAAGARAAQGARGPGTFAVALLDELAAIGMTW